MYAGTEVDIAWQVAQLMNTDPELVSLDLGVCVFACAWLCVRSRVCELVCVCCMLRRHIMCYEPLCVLPYMCHVCI